MTTTILIVDDEESVRKLVRLMLKGSEGTEFLEAKSATEALRVARGHLGPIDLLISDVVMPGTMNGIEMAATLCHARPETKVLLMSGYSPDVFRMKSEWSFVQKPFAAREIREKLRSVLTETCLAA
jgi:two-component system cell cycle sensor histidine kinase/response regulator CckA